MDYPINTTWKFFPNFPRLDYLDVAGRPVTVLRAQHITPEASLDSTGAWLYTVSDSRGNTFIAADDELYPPRTVPRQVT